MYKDLSTISILMIGFDPGLLGVGQSGDVIERHRKYASQLKRLDIIIFNSSKIKENIIADNCKVYNVGHSVFSFFKAIKLATLNHRLYGYDIFDMQDPHFAGLIGLILKKKFHKKLEVHFHGDFWNNKFWIKESWKNLFYNFLQKIIIPQVDAIRAANQIIKQKLIASGVPANIIRVINTPVNQNMFLANNQADSLAELNKKYQNKKVLLFVGRLVLAKNLFFLLEIITKLSEGTKDFVLLIIGDGAEKNSLQNKIKELHLEEFVQLIGDKTQADIATYYQAADLLLLLSSNESFGKVIIEAGFCNLPTLASRTTGAQSIITDNKNGYLVEINNFDQTLERINSIFDDENTRKKIGQQAQMDFSRDYNQEQSFINVNNFWFDIIHDRL